MECFLLNQGTSKEYLLSQNYFPYCPEGHIQGSKARIIKGIEIEKEVLKLSLFRDCNGSLHYKVMRYVQKKFPAGTKK